MPANLSDLMGLSAGAKPGASPPVPGSLPPAKGPSPLGNITNMMKSMPASGIKGMASSIIAIVIKVLEAILVGYGTESQEGKTILKAIKSLSGISKGQNTGNMQSVVQSLISALPANMQNINPADLGSALSELMGKGGGAPPAAPPGAAPGAMQPKPPMPQPGSLGAIM
jgi:hypothetical protein